MFKAQILNFSGDCFAISSRPTPSQNRPKLAVLVTALCLACLPACGAKKNSVSEQRAAAAAKTKQAKTKQEGGANIQADAAAKPEQKQAPAEPVAPPKKGGFIDKEFLAFLQAQGISEQEALKFAPALKLEGQPMEKLSALMTSIVAKLKENKDPKKAAKVLAGSLHRYNVPPIFRESMSLQFSGNPEPDHLIEKFNQTLEDYQSVMATFGEKPPEPLATIKQKFEQVWGLRLR